MSIILIVIVLMILNRFKRFIVIGFIKGLIEISL